MDEVCGHVLEILVLDAQIDCIGYKTSNGLGVESSRLKGTYETGPVLKIGLGKAFFALLFSSSQNHEGMPSK